MGRPPSSGGPVFRFTQAEVAEMEALLQQLNNAIPHFTVSQALADKFTAVRARAGQIAVQPKQVCNWFQNRKYSYRFRTARGAPTSAGPKEQHAGSVRARAPSALRPPGPPQGRILWRLDNRSSLKLSQLEMAHGMTLLPFCPIGRLKLVTRKYWFVSLDLE